MGKISLGLSAAVLLVLLAGCDGPPSPMTPVPTPSVTPVFASDEEALAAAEAAYGAYLAVSDQIFEEGGADPERLVAVAAGEVLASSLDSFVKVRANGWRSVGASAADSYELQSVDYSGGQEGTVTVYLCHDVSNVDVLDASGKSVVSPTRPDRTKFEVSFDLKSMSELLVATREVWGDGQC